MDTAKDIHEKNKIERQRRSEMNLLTHINLKCISGTEQLGWYVNNFTMFQKPTGEIFFNYDDSRLFYLVDYSWNGPKYNTVVTQEKDGQHTTKGKSGRVALGAAVGSLIAPGLGTVVGMGIGASGKKKKNIQEKTSSVSESVEIETPATLKFVQIGTNEPANILIACTSYLDTCLRCFNIVTESDTKITECTYNQNDPIEQIKKLKELLDIGAITQEEFDLKKKELLNF